MSIPPQPPSSPGPYPPPGPYGQPGQQPGPYGQQGWYAPPQMPMAPQKMNAWAVVAFCMSILCALPTVPLILGFVALSQIRTRGEKGKGFAIAAIAIHGATIAFYAIVLTLGFSGAFDDGPSPKRDTGGQVTTPGSVSLEDIRKGDCFDTGGKLAQYDEKNGGQGGSSVKIVPCTQAHEGEAYAVFRLDDGAYPGKDKVVSTAEEKCAGPELTAYVGKDAKLPESLEVFYYYPQVATWIGGDREITCFIGNPAGPTTGSLRANGS
ncbi:DUF4190 domain-containing protein [Streptomyces sp. NPDC046876]|uniref:DUF4190 domain-containing protein n=1 Tax=Streptomyces sp. NPDC046876 TaxID=3155616 RepID=UPI0033F3A9A5